MAKMTYIYFELCYTLSAKKGPRGTEVGSRASQATVNDPGKVCRSWGVLGRKEERETEGRRGERRGERERQREDGGREEEREKQKEDGGREKNRVKTEGEKGRERNRGKTEGERETERRWKERGK